MNRHKSLALALFILIFDQISKSFVISSLSVGEKLNFGWFDIHLISNTGISFGMLQNYSFLVSIAAIAITIYLIYFMWTDAAKHSFVWIGCGLVIGGAIGNLIDRAQFGYVVDFFDLRWWPAFNVADTAICIGAILLAFYFWRIEE